MYLDYEEIDQLIKSFEKDTKALKDELLRMCWFMRGSLSYSEAHLLDLQERELINKIIQSNLETTKESGLPFF